MPTFRNRNEFIISSYIEDNIFNKNIDETARKLVKTTRHTIFSMLERNIRQLNQYNLKGATLSA